VDEEEVEDEGLVVAARGGRSVMTVENFPRVYPAGCNNQATRQKSVPSLMYRQIE
jgi:hypothetical protein